jgi:hypothetical protein
MPKIYRIQATVEPHPLYRNDSIELRINIKSNLKDDTHVETIVTDDDMKSKFSLIWKHLGFVVRKEIEEHEEATR